MPSFSFTLKAFLLGIAASGLLSAQAAPQQGNLAVRSLHSHDNAHLTAENGRILQRRNGHPKIFARGCCGSRPERASSDIAYATALETFYNKACKAASDEKRAKKGSTGIGHKNDKDYLKAKEEKKWAEGELKKLYAKHGLTWMRDSDRYKCATAETIRRGASAWP